MKHCIYLSLPQGIIRTQPSHNEVVVNSKGPFHIFPRSNFNPQPCYPRMIFSSLFFFFYHRDSQLDFFGGGRERGY